MNDDDKTIDYIVDNSTDDTMLECKLNFPDGVWCKKLYPRALKDLIHEAILVANNGMGGSYTATMEYEREYPGMTWDRSLIMVTAGSRGDIRLFIRDSSGEIVEAIVENVVLSNLEEKFDGFIKNDARLS